MIAFNWETQNIGLKKLYPNFIMFVLRLGSWKSKMILKFSTFDREILVD